MASKDFTYDLLDHLKKNKNDYLLITVDKSSQNTGFRASLLFLGMVCGFFVSCLGLGGGLLLIPCLLYLTKLPYPMVVKSGFWIIIPIAIAAATIHFDSQKLNNAITTTYILGSIAGIWGSQYLVKMVSHKYSHMFLLLFLC